jgi:hypothetical protein
LLQAEEGGAELASHFCLGPAVAHGFADEGKEAGDRIDQNQRQRHRDQQFDKREAATDGPLAQRLWRRAARSHTPGVKAHVLSPVLFLARPKKMGSEPAFIAA